MLNKLMCIKYILLMFLSLGSTFAQIKVEVKIYDEYLEPFYGATVRSEDGTKFKSNTEGIVILTIPDKFPQKIIVSSDGFVTEKIPIMNKEEEINVVLKESLNINDIVVSASRTPERIIESPVDILRFGPSDIKNSTSGSIYESLGNMRGVQLINNSYGFKTINTRGFGNFDNSKFVQLVDGIDMMIPASFLAQGDFGAPNDLDIESIEILPGASSALYGSNAYNGLMLVKTKNPFDYTGIDIQLKTGMTQQSRKVEPFYDFSIREAYKFSNTFAAKVNFRYVKSNSWSAEDYRNRSGNNKELNNRGFYDTFEYDGINVYGDESVIMERTEHPLVKKIVEFRTRRKGFTEQELIGNKSSRIVNFSPGLYLRPFDNKSLEFELMTNLSISDKAVQGNLSRYDLKDFYLAKSKFEFKGDYFFLRLVHSLNKTGKDSYDLGKLGKEINEKLMQDEHYASEMFKNYFVEKSIKKLNNVKILNNARNKIEPLTNRNRWTEFINQIKYKPITEEGGSKINDKSNFVSVEGNYNFSNLLNKWGDFQLGGAYRKYTTNSEGTIFNDKDKSIELAEFGTYIQGQKSLFDKRLKLTASIRYDKSQNFHYNLSPRGAINYMLGKHKNHVLRFSYQTGYRNPTLQEQYQYIKGDSDYEYILGTARDNEVLFTSDGIEGDGKNEYSIGNYLNPKDYLGYYWWQIAKLADYIDMPGKPNEKLPVTLSLDDMINSSLLGHVQRENIDQIRKFSLSKYKRIQPENITTYELGYRSVFSLNNTSQLDISLSTFFSRHDNFIGLVKITKPFLGTLFPYGEDSVFTPEEIDELGSKRGVLPLFIKHGFLYPKVNLKNVDEKRQYAFDVLPFLSLYTGNYVEPTIYTNMNSSVKSYGLNLSLKTKVFRNFDVGMIYDFMNYEWEDKDNGLFEPSFNVPKHSVKLHLGNTKLFKNFGFGVDIKWSDKYRWISQFVRADIPARTLVDAQLTFPIPSLHSTIKLGGTNLFGKEYDIAPGAGSIGNTYYLSWVIQN